MTISREAGRITRMSEKLKMRIRTVRQIDPLWLNHEIGKRLRALRVAKGYTLAQVGIGLSVTRSAVNNWELGNQQGFMLTTLYNLALFYRVPVRKLLP